MNNTLFLKNRKVTNIKTWKKFSHTLRKDGCNLLSRLDDFPNAVLVSGCQRSGTTILSRIITKSEGMVNYWFGQDDELDAALILSGAVEHTPIGRYCFQTTYLNECIHEYFEHGNNYKLVWVLRQPLSVIYSMLYNWKDFALNELFKACGKDLLDERSQKLYRKFGLLSVNRLDRACLAYCGKVSQLFLLLKRMPKDQLFVLDYDVLINQKEALLSKLYQFLGLNYRSNYIDMIHNKSLLKHTKLSKKWISIIESRCLQIYKEASRYATLP